MESPYFVPGKRHTLSALSSALAAYHNTQPPIVAVTKKKELKHDSRTKPDHFDRIQIDDLEKNWRIAH